jgi:hypothetical protein
VITVGLLAHCRRKGEDVPEDTSQGISRRDLLRKGAVLGGAVVWVTPVVQTLGMGRAFAQTASPEPGQDISYVGINVVCEGESYFVKWEDGGGWEESPGSAPLCAEKDSLPPGVNGLDKGFSISPLNGSCVSLTVPESVADCTVTVWVKSGQTCNTYANVSPGTHPVCSVSA